MLRKFNILVIMKIITEVPSHRAKAKREKQINDAAPTIHKTSLVRSTAADAFGHCEIAYVQLRRGTLAALEVEISPPRSCQQNENGRAAYVKLILVLITELILT